MYETYADYQQNPNNFDTSVVPDINIIYGELNNKQDTCFTENYLEQNTEDKEPSTTQVSTSCKDNSPQTKYAPTPATAETGPKPQILNDLPEINNFSTMQEVCSFFHILTEDEAFSIIPKTKIEAQELLDKLSTPAISQIYKCLKGDNIYKYNFASNRLFDLVKEFEENEVAQEEKRGLAKAGTFGR